MKWSDLIIIYTCIEEFASLQMNCLHVPVVFSCGHNTRCMIIYTYQFFMISYMY